MPATPQHTPGPWTLTADLCRRVVKGGSPARSVVLIESWTTEPNARLIAAAPDLLAACEAVETFCREESNPLRLRSLVMGTIQTAIRRARGGA